MSTKVACADCGLFMILDTRVIVAEIAGRAVWRSWFADRFRCGICGSTALANYSYSPIGHDPVYCRATMRRFADWGTPIVAVGYDSKLAERYPDILAAFLAEVAPAA